MNIKYYNQRFLYHFSFTNLLNWTCVFVVVNGAAGHGVLTVETIYVCSIWDYFRFFLFLFFLPAQNLPTLPSDRDQHSGHSWSPSYYTSPFFCAPGWSVNLALFWCFTVLIDAILRNGNCAPPETNHVPPPSGWRDEDMDEQETRSANSDEKKTYTEEQRQGVLRCTVT